MFFFIVIKSLAVVYLKALGNYTGYYVSGLSRYDAISIDVYAVPLVLFSLLVFIPVWDLYKNGKFKMWFLLLASVIILFLANSSFAMMKSALLQTWHNIVMVEKRFDIEYPEEIPEELSDGKSTIVYIYSDENESDDFINYITGIQPLKIHRVKFENAEYLIKQMGISTLPAVVVSREGEMTVLQGEKEITEQLGEILHLNKLNNIFFY